MMKVFYLQTGIVNLFSAKQNTKGKYNMEQKHHGLLSICPGKSKLCNLLFHQEAPSLLFYFI